ncbi:hypothetical protein ACHAWF_015243 [Thalassiosira exigua]
MVEIYVARHGQDVDNSRGILNGRRDEPLTDLGRRQARDVAERMARAGFSLAPSSAAEAEAEGAPPPSSSSSSPVRLDAIYSSPLQRARETAEIFAEVLSSASGSNGSGDGPAPARADVLVLDDLQERDFGIMTGQPTSSILEKCGEDRVLKTETINYFLDPPGAETFPDLIVRAERLLARVRTTAASRSPLPEAILLVTATGELLPGAGSEQ